MNEDLNAIEYEIRNFGCNTMQHSLDIIHRCAERMATEIERLEKENSKLKTAVTASGFLYDAEGDLQEALFECAISNDNLRAEIARLKAELEKRPEVVFCKNCKKRDICSQIMRFPLLKQTIKKIPVNYCSLGQRRESEEGK